MRQWVLAGMTAALLAGCAEQSVMPLAQDTVRLHISTAPIYGALEPQRRATLLAAQQTVKSGYDKFVVVNGADSFHPNVIGHLPRQYQTTGSLSVVGDSTGFVGNGISQATYTGPQEVAMPRYESDVVIKMFKKDDPAAANAIDAHQILAQNR